MLGGDGVALVVRTLVLSPRALGAPSVTDKLLTEPEERPVVDVASSSIAIILSSHQLPTDAVAMRQARGQRGDKSRQLPKAQGKEVGVQICRPVGVHRYGVLMPAVRLT